jgi:hypothetical protein
LSKRIPWGSDLWARSDNIEETGSNGIGVRTFEGDSNPIPSSPYNARGKRKVVFRHHQCEPVRDVSVARDIDCDTVP